jgi:hypothetical protein
MVPAILQALRRAIQRELGSFWSIKLNNFFLFVVLIIYGCANSGVRPDSAGPFVLLLGFLLLFPLSSDPLAKIPSSRLALWPLNNPQRLGLRLAGTAFSPILWLALPVMLITARWGAVLLFPVIAVTVQALVLISGGLVRWSPAWNPLPKVPPFPGRLGGLIRNNVRQMLSVLDPYVAILLCLGGTAYRLFAAHPGPAAFPILAIMVVLALSTYAECLFSLDSASGVTRYRLLPLRGWQILLAKDIAYLSVLFVLTAPLDLRAGFTSGFATLAIGHYPSIRSPLAQHRWRFTGGKAAIGAAQAICGIGLGMAEQQFGVRILGFSALLYFASLYAGGGAWERQPHSLNQTH